MEEDADQDVRVITGGADELLRGYRLNTHIHTQSGEVKDAERKTLLGDDETVFEYFGAIKRTAVLAQQGSIEKCSALRINSAGTLLAAQSTGKVVEVGDSLRSAVLHRAVLFVMHSALLSFCDSNSAPSSPLFSFPLHLTSIRPLTSIPLPSPSTDGGAIHHPAIRLFSTSSAITLHTVFRNLILSPLPLFSTSSFNCCRCDYLLILRLTRMPSPCYLFVQIFRLRDDTEAKKKMKRRQKRMREKAEKDKEKLLKGSTETAGSAPTVSAACTVSLIVDSRH